MAIYHLSAKVIGRSSGRSATGAAAYRAAEIVRDERTGIVHDYSRKGGVEHREIVAPDNAPAWMRDREQLWNAVEKVERRKDAQLAREVEVGIPRELTPDQRRELVREFVREEFVSRGMIADVCWHMGKASDGGAHPHAHILLTMRELTGDGFGNKNRDWNGKDVLEGWRERWEAHANRALERAGRDERIDHRSFADRGVDREPQPKLGPVAAKLERQGIVTERGDELRAVEARNTERAELEVRRDGLSRQIEAVREALAALRERAEETAARAGSAVRDAWSTVRDKVSGWLGGDRGAASPPADHARADAPRDTAGMARTEPPAVDRGEGRDQAASIRDVDRLLGRSQAPERGEERTADADRLLGRGTPASDPERPTADSDRLLGRGGGSAAPPAVDPLRLLGLGGGREVPGVTEAGDKDRGGGDRDR